MATADVKTTTVRTTAFHTRVRGAARLMREALSAGEDHQTVFAHFLAQMDEDEARALRAALRRRRRPNP
jgi:hypothetical protein